MRGLIPVLVAAEMERRSGRHLTTLFDLIVGTSTGGILALGLSAPGASGSPAFTAAQLVNFYTAQGATIFPGGGRGATDSRILGSGGSLTERMLNSAQRIGAPFGGNPRFARNARYFPAGLERALNDAFGPTRLRDALVDVLVTAYDAKAASAVMFSRSEARASAATNISMVDAARATSAAPTFFPAVEILWNGRSCSFVDGGVWANNPSVVALTESLKITSARSLTGTSVLLVSLGTGQPPPRPQFDPHRPWLSTVTDMVALGTGTDDSHRVLERVLGPSGSGRYWRFQPIGVDLGGAMDDATPARIASLSSTAASFIETNSGSIDQLITALT